MSARAFGFESRLRHTKKGANSFDVKELAFLIKIVGVLNDVLNDSLCGYYWLLALSDPIDWPAAAKVTTFAIAFSGDR